MNLVLFSLLPCLVYWGLGLGFNYMEGTKWAAKYRVQPRPVPKDAPNNTVTLSRVLRRPLRWNLFLGLPPFLHS